MHLAISNSHSNTSTRQQKRPCQQWLQLNCPEPSAQPPVAFCSLWLDKGSSIDLAEAPSRVPGSDDCRVGQVDAVPGGSLSSGQTSLPASGLMMVVDMELRSLLVMFVISSRRSFHLKVWETAELIVGWICELERTSCCGRNLVGMVIVVFKDMEW